MKVYKVTRVLDSKIVSCCRNDSFPERFRVEYKIGEYVTPNPEFKDSMLFAFKSLDEAKEFSDSLYGCSVYEADAIGVTKVCYPQTIVESYIVSSNLERFVKYWTEFAKNRKSRKKLPSGNPQRFHYQTGVCCEQIKLIQKVY